MRLFVGIFLEVSLREAVTHVCNALSEACPSMQAAVKWVQPENLHLTLKFLGSVSPEKLPALTEALHEAATVGAFDIALCEFNAFPCLAHPQILWIGVGEGAPYLANLAACIDDRLTAVGFPKETRKFAAHVTIGRVRQGYRLSGLARAAQTLKPVKLGRQHVDSFALIESRLTPSGSLYALRENIALTASR
ncbi:MAG: RNA 2',3'-cyclic phosphodiesterase [Candidatus Thermochlorobacter sp.]